MLSSRLIFNSMNKYFALATALEKTNPVCFEHWQYDRSLPLSSDVVHVTNYVWRAYASVICLILSTIFNCFLERLMNKYDIRFLSVSFTCQTCNDVNSTDFLRRKIAISPCTNYSRIKLRSYRVFQSTIWQ